MNGEDFGTAHVSCATGSAISDHRDIMGTRQAAAWVGHGTGQVGLMDREAAPWQANSPGPDRPRVMFASNRPSLLSAWFPRLQRAAGIECCAEVLDQPACLGRSVERQLPAVLLLDKALLDRVDPESLRTMHERCASTRVILLWDEHCDGVVVDVLRHHFHGFLLTTCLHEECLKAIQVVMRGELWLSRAALARALAELLSHPSSLDAMQAAQWPGRSGTQKLTPRERQIVELLRLGRSNKEIAHELGVMEDTVKKHMQGVFDKLGVRRRALVALRSQPGESNST